MLRVRQLHRRIGSFHLRVDELHVRRGEYLTLIGPSGAGKTMLLETIAGLHHPDSGRIWIGERDATRLPPEARGIGLVYQDCWLFPHLSVRENIEFGRRYHRRHVCHCPPEARSAVADSVNSASAPALLAQQWHTAPGTNELAAMLELSDLLERRPDTLSGGERQRVALARALAIRPCLLFLDEPLGTLDPLSREQVAAELRRCHDAFGMTTIHVTHDHTEARMMGDVAAVMLQGRLEPVQLTDALFHRPRIPQLAAFVGCENLLAAHAVPAGGGMVEVRLDGQPPMLVASPLSGTVTLCIRPEDLLVRALAGIEARSAERCQESLPRSGPKGASGTTTHDPFATSTFAGRIVRVSERGPVVRLEIEVPPRRWVSLMGAGEFRRAGLGIGDAVEVIVQASAVHLMGMS